MSATQEHALEELDVLLPHRDITLAGETVTVREYSLLDSLQLHTQISTFSNALADVLRQGIPAFEVVQAVIAEQNTVIMQLVAKSVGRDPAWVASLSATEGTELLDRWWAVNARFFMRAAQRLILGGIAESAALKKQLALAKSSQPSSQPDTTQSGSGTTPSGS